MSDKKVGALDLHKVNVVLTNGESFEVETSWGKEGDTLKLDVDPYNHPAWRKDQGVFLNANNTRVTNFKKKYEGMF
jgi:large subunit ribosomal protein L31